MVSTRACKMDSEKNGINNIGSEKSSMRAVRAGSKSTNSSNPESEEDEQNTHAHTSRPPGSVGGSAIKVTLKKTRSCSSTSSRESAQSFEVVKNAPPANESVSEEEDDENPKDSDNEKTSDKQSGKHSDENEKESDEEGSQNTIITDDYEIEILSSDDDCTEKENLKANPVSVKEENKLSLINTIVDLKTEEPVNQNLATVKNEDCKIKVKSLKEELIKEAMSDGDIVVLNDDNVNDITDVPQKFEQSQNGIEKKSDDIKETIKEQKFKVNVRSFDDLAAPRPPSFSLMNNGYNLIDGQQNFLTQNGSTSFTHPFLNLPCDVCGIQFDSSELLNDHKTAMKHFKCTFKECEHLVVNSQQELLDHQSVVHNILPSPVQQLAHQVQRLPSMGFDQQLQSGVPPLSENLPPPSGVPNMYTPPLRMPSQPVPVQRPMRPMMRSNMPQHMMSSRGRGIVQRASRGRSMSLNANMVRGTMKRPSSMPMRPSPPIKRLATDRNSYSNSMNKTQIVKSLSESLTKSANKTPSAPSQQDVVNLFSKRGLTISTVDTVNNISLPAGLSLNSAVTIIPSSPQKNLDTVDLTGPDKPRVQKKYYPCEICSKTYLSVESMYEHVSSAHKSVSLPFNCNLCSGHFPNADVLHRHKVSVHKSEMNSSLPYGIPIFDFTKAGTAARLQSMGVTSYMPVAQLNHQGGHFGVPIMSVSRPGSLEGLRYTNFFNLGCVRKL